jgi:hypothetical protein
MFCVQIMFEEERVESRTPLKELQRQAFPHPEYIFLIFLTYRPSAMLQNKNSPYCRQMRIYSQMFRVNRATWGS